MFTPTHLFLALLQVRISAPVNVTLGVDRNNGTIFDVDTTPNLTIADISVLEDTGSITLTVTAAPQSGLALIPID